MEIPISQENYYPTDPTLFLTAQAWATRRHGGDIGFGWCDGVDGGARI